MRATLAVSLIALIGLCIYLSYNRFVAQRQLIDNSWSNIDTELQRRYDLIPNLVSTVKGYAAHEHELFRRVAEARAEAQATDGPTESGVVNENALVGTLRQMLAVAEANPELQADQNFRSLQDELAVTENRIQAARRFFTNNVRDYNTRVEAFPSNIVARLFGFRLRTYFEVEPAVREARGTGF